MKRRELLDLAKQLYTEDEIFELELAIDFATHAHYGQKRKSGEPYITHPLAVAGILIDWAMDIDTILAGVLHDTIEDTDATLDEIESLFGHDVAFLVDGVTKVGRARAGMKNLENYLPQTTDNLSKLLVAVSQDVRVIIIKLADRLHNLRTLKYMSEEKQKKIAKESLDVFGRMADRLGMGQVRMQIEELAFSYLDPHEFNRLRNIMKKRLGKSTRKLGTVRIEVEKRLKNENISFEINGRVKSIYSLYKKLKKVNGNIDDIYDLMALRIIVNTNEDCYRVLGILHSMYQPMIARIKDYISVPKPNASFHYHDQKSSKDYTRKRKISQLPPQLQWITRLQEIAQQLTNNEEISREQLNVDLFNDRIFVYSPKGDIYNLPEGSLPLDFAYLIHTDIGKHAYAFKVNGSIQAFDKPLANGDMVEIITRKTTAPKKEWLDLTITSHARSKIRNQLKRNTSVGALETLVQTTEIIRRKTKTDHNESKNTRN